MKNYVKNCKYLNTCKNGINKNCIGCNIWNVLYNYSDFVEWCINQNKNVMTEHFNIKLNLQASN